MFYWVEFNVPKYNGTIFAQSDALAEKIASQLAICSTCENIKVISVKTLPYPANPYLMKIEHPAFCFEPNKCKGHTSCPNRYRACSE